MGSSSTASLSKCERSVAAAATAAALAAAAFSRPVAPGATGADAAPLSALPPAAAPVAAPALPPPALSAGSGGATALCVAREPIVGNRGTDAGAPPTLRESEPPSGSSKRLRVADKTRKAAVGTEDEQTTP